MEFTWDAYEKLIGLLRDENYWITDYVGYEKLLRGGSTMCHLAT